MSKFHAKFSTFIVTQDEIIKLDEQILLYEGWNFNSANYLFTTDTK